VVHACTHKMREIAPGGIGILQVRAADVLPGITDRAMSHVMYRLHQSFKPRPPRGPDNLYGPGNDLEERSGFKKLALPVSPLTEAQLHPALSVTVLAAVGLAGWWGIASRRARRPF
jgi:hypothetical protein